MGRGDGLPKRVNTERGKAETRLNAEGPMFAQATHYTDHQWLVVMFGNISVKFPMISG